MKKTLLFIQAIVLLAVSCTDYKSQIDDLQKELDQLTRNLDALEDISANLSNFRNLLIIAQTGDPILSAVPSADGYAFTFTNNGQLAVGNNTAGISASYSDGNFFWTIDGEPLSGAKVPVSVTPQFRTADGSIEVSVDGKNWITIPANGSPVISKLEENASSITATLLGATELVFPKETALTLSLSGDGGTLASEGKAVVDYFISGGDGDYDIMVAPGEGVSAVVAAETDAKGTITFTSLVNSFSDNAEVYVSDGAGHISCVSLNLASLKPDGQFPTILPTYEAYNIAYDGGTAEVEMTTNLQYEINIDSEAASWLSVAGTKAMRTDKISFTAGSNDSAQMRSALVTFESGSYSRSIYIYQNARPASVAKDLSANGTANCYIVPGAGEYYFDATVMGNGSKGIIKDAGFHTEDASLEPVEADIIEISEEIPVENVRLENGKVYFTATGTKGNVLIYVTGASGSVIWSWHIWCADIPEERMHTNGDGQQLVMLDRNLGATSADPADGEATYGLYYQWGRKDPFAADSFSGSMSLNSLQTIQYGVQRPFRPLRSGSTITPDWVGNYNNYLWGNPDYINNHPVSDLVKSIYDPCPAGYMVPPPYVLSIFRDESKLEFVENGFYLRGDCGQRSFYPYSGSIYNGIYNAFGGNGDDVCAIFWNSTIARYHLEYNDAGSTTTVTKQGEKVEVDKADLRAKGIPVRCVKQQ